MIFFAIASFERKATHLEKTTITVYQGYNCALFPLPMIVSTSQSPNLLLSATACGRSSIHTRFGI